MSSSTGRKPFVWYQDGEFMLCRIGMPYTELPVDEALQQSAYPTEFSVPVLCAALQNGCHLENIKSYLASYPYETVKFKLAADENSWPALFYAAERNSPGLVLALLEYGADPTVAYKFRLPVLAFAILHGKQRCVDTTDVVKVFLAFGVDPKVIPEDMWSGYLRTPRAEVPLSGVNLDPASPSAWCTPYARADLAPALHLTLRYLLYQANSSPRFNGRTFQIANAHKMIDLLKITYHLVGQAAAGGMVRDDVFAHIASHTAEPLVMAFAGPSGHGKTEMAKRMGELLCVPITTIDCAQFSTDMGLFGARAGYYRSGEGSQLNNFLAANDGQRAVVFLDEFDKTGKEIRNSLLLLCDSGAYFDRRNNAQLDCSKTIWVIATNLGDKKIMEFYDAHVASKEAINIETLQTDLSLLFRNKFGGSKWLAEASSAA